MSMVILTSSLRLFYTTAIDLLASIPYNQSRSQIYNFPEICLCFHDNGVEFEGDIRCAGSLGIFGCIVDSEKNSDSVWPGNRRLSGVCPGLDALGFCRADLRSISAPAVHLVMLRIGPE